jgi:hypothetical protein
MASDRFSDLPHPRGDITDKKLRGWDNSHQKVAEKANLSDTWLAKNQTQKRDSMGAYRNIITGKERTDIAICNSSFATNLGNKFSSITTS